MYSRRAAEGIYRQRLAILRTPFSVLYVQHEKSGSIVKILGGSWLTGATQFFNEF